MKEKILLEELLYNYRRLWDREVREFITYLFSGTSPERWEFLLRGGEWSDEVEELLNIKLSRLDKERLEKIVEGKLGGPGDRKLRELGKAEVAYFCAEFGIDDSLPNYAGGLGILAGDHLKTAADLNLPTVGVGIWYPGGYFTQKTTEEGDQLAVEISLSPEETPLRPVLSEGGKPYEGRIVLGGKDVYFTAWYAKIGGNILYLLDPHVEKNSDEWREPFYQLYGSHGLERLKMELFLGFGGVKLLEDLGISAERYHLNEGHTGFVSLARLAGELSSGRGLEPALEEIRKSQIFTTHTPVEAGHDRFEISEVSEFLKGLFPKELVGEILELGREKRGGKEFFCMTVLGIRTAAEVNGVSRLHREVTAEMWKEVLSDSSAGRLSYITNGIHVESWIYRGFEELFREVLGPDWLEELVRGEGGQRLMEELPSERVWEVKLRAKEELFQFFRERLVEGRAHGSDRVLNSREAGEILAVGFARRFAAYKRADLIFEEEAKLSELLNDIDRPVVIFFAGKAHPRDLRGQKILRRVVKFSGDERFRGKILWLDDYSIEVAKRLVWGVDLWLNNPIPPMEASGTSGQKVLCNFGLNCSIPDGWWAEVGEGMGWKIGKGENYGDERVQRERDAEALYTVLKGQVLPKFFSRGERGYPEGWVQMAKRSAAELLGRFSTRRMLREYIKLYRGVS